MRDQDVHISLIKIHKLIFIVQNVTSTEECIEYITSKIEKTKLLLVVTMEMKMELAQDGMFLIHY